MGFERSSLEVEEESVHRAAGRGALRNTGR
jgi:hypothetical protein